MLDKIAAAGLDAHISIKPTQLGLDLDRGLCERNTGSPGRARRAAQQLRLDRHGGLAVRRSDAGAVQAVARASARVGIAIQAYLYRTPKDIEALIPLGPAIRIVKGAYLEPPDIAYPKKSTSTRRSTSCARG